MAIPLSNMQKEVNTPNASRGQAVDLTQEAQASIAMARDFAGSIVGGTEKGMLGVLQYKKSQQDIQDMTVANKAYNEYMQNMTDLNAVAQAKEGAEAVAFEEEYNKRATEYHTNLLGVLDNDVTNPTVKENVRQHVNSYNQQNRANSFTFFDKSKKEYAKTTSVAADDNTINNAKPKFSNGQSANNANTMNLMFVDLDANAISRVAADGYKLIPDNGHLTKEQKEINRNVMQVIRQEQQKSRQRAVNEITEYLDEHNTDTTPWKSSASSIALLKSLEGKLDASYVRDKYKELELRQLEVELKRSPEKFWDANSGAFIAKECEEHCPHLRQDEYWQAARKVGSGNGARGNAKAQEQIQAESRSILFNILEQNGLAELAAPIAKAAGINEAQLPGIYEESRRANKSFMYNSANIANIRNLLNTVYHGKAAVSNNGSTRSVKDENDVSENESYISLVRDSSVREVINSLDGIYREAMVDGDYDKVLDTKLLMNVRPTVSDVASSVAGDVMYNYQHLGYWARFKNWIKGDTSKRNTLGPLYPGMINAAVNQKVQEKLNEYGYNAMDVENDSLVGKVIFKEDAKGDPIKSSAVLFDLLVSTGIAEGMLDVLPADAVRSMFGSTDKKAISNKILQHQRDFMKRKVEDPRFAASGTGGVMVWKSPTKEADKRASETNSLSNLIKNTDSALKKNSAEILSESKVGEDGKLQLPDNITGKLPDLEKALPYPKKDSRTMEELLTESLWGDVQYANVPTLDVFMLDNVGNEDSYLTYANNRFSKESAFNILRDDGVLDHVENKLDLIKVSGNAATAVKKSFVDYISGAGIYSENLRNVMAPSIIDANGNFNIEMPANEYQKIPYQLGKFKQPEKAKKAKLYMVSPNDQYYIDKNGDMHMFRLDSNDLYLQIMLMAGRSYKPSMKNQATYYYNMPTERQYVDGGAFKRSFYGGANAKVITSNEDFSFR